MPVKTINITRQNKDAIAVVMGTVAILLIPLIAMQFTTEVNWSGGDFMVAGMLLLVSGFTYVILSRTLPKLRLVISLLVGLIFLYLWTELAVGIFTNWGR